jgi:hypothetical protein
MSTCPNSEIATLNMWDSAGQEVTSVLQKTARGPLDLPEYWVRSAWASGRRDRSAMRTEHPRERRRDAKEKFMPGVCVSFEVRIGGEKMGT